MSVRDGSASPDRFRIPEYATTTGEARAQLDAIIAGFDTGSVDAARAYCDDAMTEVSQVTAQIILEMSSEPHGVFRTPVQECLDTMAEFDLERLQDSLSDIIRNGGRVVMRNKATLVTGAAMTILTGPFWAAATAGGAVGAREFIRRKMQPRFTPEEVEDRIRDAVVKSSDQIGNLKAAEQHVPVVLGRIGNLARANYSAYTKATLGLSAGREILRRIYEDEIPALQAAADREQTFEAHEALRAKESVGDNLSHKLKVVELGRAETILGTDDLAEMNQAIEDNNISLQSILIAEMPHYQRALATAGLALDSWRTTRVTESFRDHVEGIRADATAAAHMAQEASVRGRIDHPERMQKVIDRIVALRTSLTTRQTALNSLETTIAEKRRTLESEVTNLLVAQADLASSRTRPALAPPPPAVTVQILDQQASVAEPAARNAVLSHQPS